MKLERLTQADLERASGIDRTTISRFQRGERIPDRDQLGRLCTAISQERPRRLELLLAHLRDEAAAGLPAGLDERHFIVAPAPDQAFEAINVSGSLAADLQLIADECVQHDDIRKLVDDLAHLIVRHRAELADVIDFHAHQAAEPPADFATGVPLPADQVLAEEKRRRRERRDSQSAS